MQKDTHHTVADVEYFRNTCDCDGYIRQMIKWHIADSMSNIVQYFQDWLDVFYNFKFSKKVIIKKNPTKFSRKKAAFQIKSNRCRGQELTSNFTFHLSIRYYLQLRLHRNINDKIPARVSSTILFTNNLISHIFFPLTNSSFISLQIAVTRSKEKTILNISDEHQHFGDGDAGSQMRADWYVTDEDERCGCKVIQRVMSI